MKKRIVQVAGLTIILAGITFLSATDKSIEPATSELSGANAPNEGVSTIYWSSGSLKEEGTLLEGKRQSVWKSYYPNGERSELGQYRNGKRVGIWTFWNENGAFNRIEEYPAQSPVRVMPATARNIYQLTHEGTDWKMLAICAAYCLEHATGTTRQDEALLSKGLEFIASSIQQEEHYWNTSVKAQLLYHRNFNQAKATAAQAIQLGLEEIPDFYGSEEHNTLLALSTMDGC